jgi:macrolide-specific efflux system membrane fusion protein
MGRMERRLATRLVAGVSASLLLTLVAGCASDAGSGGAAILPGASFAVVALQDVTPVVVVDATVSAYPRIAVTAPVDGVPILSVSNGEVVVANQPIGSIGGRPITAPAGGNVEAIRVPAGVSVPPDSPLLVIEYAGFGAQAVVAPADAYRAQGEPVAGRASLQYGAAGFTCVLASPDATTGGALPGSDQAAAAPADVGGRALVCLIPNDIRAYEGERIQVGVEYQTVKAALVLPVGSVSGSAQSGTVRRYSDSGPGALVAVQLGISDGVVVQIASGLSVGDRVSSTPPELGGS